MAFVGYGEPYSESSNLSHQSPVEAIDNPIINAPPSAPPNAFQQPQQETAGGNGPPIQPGNDAPSPSKSAPVHEDVHGTEGGRVLVPKSSISTSYPHIPIEHHSAPPLEYEDPVDLPAQDVEHQPCDDPTLDNINASEQDDTNDQDDIDGSQQLSANHQQGARPNVLGVVQNIHQQNHARNQLEPGNQRKKKRWHWLIPILIVLIFSLGAGVVGTCYAVVEHPTAKPQYNKQCQLYYILSLDSVQCGAANSHEYAEIQIEGVLRSGDTLQGTVMAWVIPEVDLELSAWQYPPASHNISTSSPRHILLSQLEDIYLWVNSTVYGNCCIVNHGSTETNALLNIFTDNDDVQNFEKGIIPKSDVLYENITIPPHVSRCFSRWGPETPLKVNVSSYYHIGISVPANTTLYSNVTITQLLVNTSGYGPPHYVGSDNSTVFTLSSGENIAICEAPPSLQTPSSGVGAESLHVQTCNEPKQAQAENPAMYFVIVGILFALCVFTLVVFFCLLCFFISQKCKKDKPNDIPNYGAIGSTDNLIQ